MRSVQLIFLIAAIAASLHAGKPGGGGTTPAGPVTTEDGVVLIDQNAATAGGVSAGDAAGFPVSINTPGHYRLSGPLAVNANTNAIEIGASNVTIDLNGFSITGPNTCQSFVCAQNGTGVGIKNTVNSLRNITIKNGAVEGMGAAGISVNAPARIENVDAVNNGGTGIYVGIKSLVTDSRSSFNGGSGIQVLSSSIVTRCLTHSNATHGIYIQDGSSGGWAQNISQYNQYQQILGLDRVSFGTNICNVVGACPN